MLLLKNIFVILLLGFISSYVEGMRRCFRGQQNAQHGGHIVKLFFYSFDFTHTNFLNELLSI